MQPDSGISGLWKRWTSFNETVELGLQRRFVQLAQAGHGKQSRILMLSVFVWLAACGVMLSTQVELRMEKIVIPAGSKELDDLDKSVEFFGTDDAVAMLVLSPRPGSTDNNVASIANLLAIASLEHDITTATTAFDGRNISYSDVCARLFAAAPCMQSSVMAYWGFQAAALEATAGIVNQLLTAPASPGNVVQRSNVLSAPTLAADGTFESAEAALTTLFVRGVERQTGSFTVLDLLMGTMPAASEQEVWEKLFLELAAKYNNNASFPLDVSYFAYRSTQDAFIDTAVGSLALVVGCLVVMVVYVSIIFFSYGVNCRMWLLGMAGVANVVASVTIGLAITVLAQVPMTVSSQFTFFLALGIGMDGVFVVMDVFDSCPDGKTLREQMEHTMRHAGPSVTIASITDVLAFAVASATSFPLIRMFCVSTMVVLLVNYVMLWTFYASVLRAMALQGRLQENIHKDARHGSTNQPSGVVGLGSVRVPVEALATSAHSQEEAPSSGDRKGTPGKGGTVQRHLHIIEPREAGSPRSKKGGSIVPDDSEGLSFAMRMLLDHILPVLLKPHAKAAVLLASVALAAFSIRQVATKMDASYGTRDILRDDAPLHYFLDDIDAHFAEMPVEANLVVSDFSPVADNMQIMTLTTALNDSPFSNGDGVVFANWYNEWWSVCYLGNAPVLPPVTSANVTAMVMGQYCGEALQDVIEDFGPGDSRTERFAVASVRHFVSVYPWYSSFVSLKQLQTDSSADYNLDDETTTVPAMKVRYTLRRLVGAADMRAALAKTIAITEESRLTCFVYGPDFISFRMYEILGTEVAQNLVSAVAIALLVLLVFIHPVAVMCVVLVVILVDVDLAGAIPWFGYYLNPVTLSTLTISVGLSLDYSAHVAHAFVTATGSHNERTAEALVKVGKAVLNGGMTTALGLGVLRFAPAAVFRTFTELFLYMVLLGELHGLVVLPALLSIVGPQPVFDEKAAHAWRTSQVDGHDDGKATPRKGKQSPMKKKRRSSVSKAIARLSQVSRHAKSTRRSRPGSLHDSYAEETGGKAAQNAWLDVTASRHAAREDSV